MPSQTVYIQKEWWEKIQKTKEKKVSTIINEALELYFKKKEVKGGD